MAITADEVKLRGNVAICVHSNSYRTIRGKSLIACIFDEVAFWRDETSAAPDLETYGRHCQPWRPPAACRLGSVRHIGRSGYCIKSIVTISDSPAMRF